MKTWNWRLACAVAVALVCSLPLSAQTQLICTGLPSHAGLRMALSAALDGNGGLGNEMWASVVNRDGQVCRVVFSGDDRDDQWPGSRVIAMQKANTANAFSVAGLALSTANLFTAVQPGGSLFGLQESNPVDVGVAYKGPAQRFGQSNDPALTRVIGGVNVFGGGLPLYGFDEDGAVALIGAIGVSGDTSCTDHIVAWRVRDALGLDMVPAGVSATGDDNIIHDSANGFAHPECDPTATDKANDLPVTNPIGS